MSSRRYVNTKVMAAFAVLAITGLGMAQESSEFDENHGKRHFTLASLEGNYAITGVYGAHAAGFVGTTDINSKGVVSNSSGIFIDLTLPGPLELSPITGNVTINPDGTGVFTLDITFVGGPAHVLFHLNYVVTDTCPRGTKLVATRMVGLQQESSNIPGAEFATLTLTRRSD